MSVQEESVKDYVESLDDWKAIDIYHDDVTVPGLKEGSRSTYGQTTAAFRYAKKAVKELKQYTSIKESLLLGELHSALLGIPDISPDDIKDVRKIGGIIKALRSIGDFDKKQMAIIEWGEKWIEFGQCSATDSKVIKKMVFAMAFLLKAIEYDLEKDIDTPFVKAGVTLLSVQQRSAHLQKVKEFLLHLDKKSLVAAEKPKLDRQERLLRHKVLEVSVTEDTNINNLTKQVDDLLSALDEQQKEIVSEKGEMILRHKKTLAQIYELKISMASTGMAGFWQHFESEVTFCDFLDCCIEKESHSSMLRDYYLQRDLKWYQKMRHSSWESDLFWKLIQGIDGAVSYFCFGVSLVKNSLLKQIAGEGLTVARINQKLDNRLAQIIDDYTQLAPNESIDGDKVSFVLGYHDKKVKEIQKILNLSSQLKAQLSHKNVAKFLINYIKNTSWWVWLISSEYRKVTNTILNLLHDTKNPSSEKLKLIYQLLDNTCANKDVLSLARVELEKMMYESFDLVAEEHLETLLPDRSLSLSRGLAFYQKRMLFFKGAQHSEFQNASQGDFVVLQP